MGYLCPVCEEPFADEGQCANHLAVTAILHGGPHETWLAEAVADREAVDDTADWESVPREELATIVADRAAETTDHDHPGDHTHPIGDSQPVDGEQPATGGHQAATGGQPAITETDAETAQLDAEAQSILSEARELTRKMQDRGPGDEGKES
ncbi:MAG: DUF5810 domain-containing protein [Euryarchaeota archaeon]|nr:DUF5810 domain-containing protein [Euryarchaeota archaeon]